MLHCYNRGCGQTYDPETNTDESCCHHPGEPYFHDAYKGWSCCKKKSVDFTEFLNFKGCTLSKHSNVKPPEPVKQAKDTSAEKDEVIEVRAPIKSAMERPPVDTPLKRIHATVAAGLKDAIDTHKTKSTFEVTKDVQLNEGEVTMGTSCKNAGCTYSYNGSSTDDGECQYHPGVPIFHEGMKYWSCCQRKTSDFSVFMAQKGCAYSHHKWFKKNDKKLAQCRYDWHQTARDVIVSIYAKLYHYSQSSIEVNPVRLHVNLIFPAQDNAAFKLDLELRGVIDVDKTTAQMYATKVEITMPKAEPGSWPRLEFPQAKLPPPRRNSIDRKSKRSESDDDISLDDVELVNQGMRLSEICSQKSDLD